MPDDLMDTPEYAQGRELPDAGAPVTGGETLHGYRIEARLVRPGVKIEVNPHGPSLDTTWRVLPVSAGDVLLPGADASETAKLPKGAVVIPIPGEFQDMVKHGILPYAAAQAHRWGFHSAMSCIQGDFCDDIETRLVLVTFKQAFEIIEVGVTDGATQYDAEMDQIPLHDRASYALPDGEDPQPADGDAGLAEDVDAVSAETLAQDASEDENADLAEEPAPKPKGKAKAQGAKPASKKKKG